MDDRRDRDGARDRTASVRTRRHADHVEQPPGATRARAASIVRVGATRDACEGCGRAWESPWVQRIEPAKMRPKGCTAPDPTDELRINSDGSHGAFGRGRRGSGQSSTVRPCRSAGLLRFRSDGRRRCRSVERVARRASLRALRASRSSLHSIGVSCSNLAAAGPAAVSAAEAALVDTNSQS